MIHKPLLTNKLELRFIALLGLMLLFFMLISMLWNNKVERGNVSKPTLISEDYFKNLDLKAKAVYVYDLKNKKVLFERNSNTRMPLASLTKVMTALVAYDIAPKFSVISISNEALKTDGNSGFKTNEKWNLKKLLDYSLTSSSNDGMAAVAIVLGALNKSSATKDEAVNDFVVRMNKKADELNLKNTYYFNETGLDQSETTNGAYGTAKDMTKLFEYIITQKPEVLEATRMQSFTVDSENNIKHIALNTDKIISEIPGLLASKTGFTDIAGGNLVIAFDPELGRPIIIAVLGSTEDGRFEDMDKLVKASLNTIKDFEL